MTAPHANQLIDGYLARLEVELADAPHSRKQEILDDVRNHIQEARAQLSEEGDAEILNLLDKVGDPAQVAAEGVTPGARTEMSSPRPTSEVGLLEIAALILTPLLWPIGVVLLWTSSAWNVRDKLIGTLVPPGGYLGILFGLPVLLVSGMRISCSSGYTTDRNGHVLSSFNNCPDMHLLTFVSVVVLVLLLLSPTISAAYLGWRLRRSHQARRGPADVSLQN